MKVAVFGLGYVGTVTAACLASRGHEVCGVDVDSAKVDMIAGGRSPVIEPGLDQLVSDTVSRGTLRTTTERPGRSRRRSGLTRVRRDAVCAERQHRPALRAEGRRRDRQGTQHQRCRSPSSTAW